MPLTLTRAATVLSLTQLSEGEPKGSPAKGQLSNPDCPVSSIAAGASLLPLYTFPAADGFAAKRVRSFGSIADLATGGGAAVPDAYDDLARCGGRGAACMPRVPMSCRHADRLPAVRATAGGGLPAGVVTLTASPHPLTPYLPCSCSRCRCSAGSSDEDAALGSENSFDGGSAAQVVPQRSVLDALLLGEWEDRAE